jgi:hypothetical protein
MAASLLGPAKVYTAVWAQGRQEWERLLPAWRATHRRYTPSDFGSDPDWCQGTEAAYPGCIQLLKLCHNQDVAVVPFMLRRAPLDCRIGEYKLFRFRPWLLMPAGEELGMGEEVDAWEAMLTAIVKPVSGWQFDALRFTAATDSFQWAFLQGTPWQRWGLRPYVPHPAARHHRINMPVSFAAYAAKFTAKTRGNRARELKTLQKRGRVELIRFQHPEQVPAFLAEAGEISRRSYQHRLLDAGLPPAERLWPRLQVAARCGWWRSYVLRCDGVPCSYMLGYQYASRFHYMAIGYDPAWKPLCVGTVLQWMVLQDMFVHEPPATFDLGVEAPQKHYYGNESFAASELLLLRSGLYGWLMRSVHHGSGEVEQFARRALERYGLKPTVQHWLRRIRGC